MGCTGTLWYNTSTYPTLKGKTVLPYCTQHKTRQESPLSFLFQYLCCIYTSLVCMCFFQMALCTAAPHRRWQWLSLLPCPSAPSLQHEHKTSMGWYTAPSFFFPLCLGLAFISKLFWCMCHAQTQKRSVIWWCYDAYTTLYITLLANFLFSSSAMDSFSFLSNCQGGILTVSVISTRTNMASSGETGREHSSAEPL